MITDIGMNVPIEAGEEPAMSTAVDERHELADRIGMAVRTTRRELGLDQATTALLAQVSVRFLRELEHGKDTVQLRQLLAVLDVLGLRLELASDDA